jgi:hypothetical protein
MTHTMTGGCQCGRIRYAAEIEKAEAYLCHCRMCQRATGGISIAFVNLKTTAIGWAQEPDWFHSSPIARRPFCAACGTPLGFQYLDSENCDLTSAASMRPAISNRSTISARRACMRHGSTRAACPATAPMNMPRS